jgi:ankyrin repeat protein
MRTKPDQDSSTPSIEFEQRPTDRFAIAKSFSLILVLLLSTGLLGQDAKGPQETNVPAVKAEAAKPNFDKVGPQVGDQLPALNLRTMKGETQRLGDAWHGGPALLVTSSLTCPKSRSRWPELKAIVEKYGDRLNVVVVYVIEAHPVGSICPYKGVEDVTPENERDDILRRQPTTLEDRLELAEEFKRYLRVSTPIYVDTVNNQAWKAFGAAPNIALLVDVQGIVAARESWFEGQAMQHAIDKYLGGPGRPKPKDRRSRMDYDRRLADDKLLQNAGFHPFQLRSIIRNQENAKLAEFLKQHPELAKYVFPIEQGHLRETTLLMEAVQERNLAAAELLLSQGADVTVQTSSFDSALQLAAQTGELKAVKLLLGHHADPSFPRTGKTPLHEAALAGHQEVARLLIDAGAHGDFYSDIALGNIDAVRESLVADPSLALRPDGAGRMPLDYAAANGQVDVASLLLASGTPVVEDLRASIDPPVHRAIHRGDAPMVKLLLDAGSSPNTAVGRGGENSSWTPALHLAIGERNPEIVGLLLAHKADLGARNTYSKTALHVAADGQPEIAEMLIRAGADVNAPQLRFSLPCGSGEEETPSLNNPLHFAAARGNPRTIKVLIDGGAKLDARNVKGKTPLMSTVEPPLYTGINEESQLQNIETLIAAGADINARDNKGGTILDAAMADLESEKSHRDRDDKRQALQDLIDLLKKHGAKPGAPKTKE